MQQAIDINVLIGCGVAPVLPGDVILGDADGVAVIPAHPAGELAPTIDEVGDEDRQCSQAEKD